MKSPSLLALCLALSGSLSLPAQDDTVPAIKLEEAIKLGPEGIAQKRGDESEVGYAEAATYWAAARRLKTENELAAKDLGLVVELGRYRSASSEWEMAWSEAIYAAAGGGTMWARMPSHLAAGREETLAKLAARMPLEPAEPKESTLAPWKALGEVIQKAPAPEFADETSRQGWSKQMESLHSIWERLYYELQALSDNDAKLMLEHLLPEEEQIGMLKGQ